MKTTIGNGKRGITLIALIITVIVMLILAGVSISVLTGNEGLFDKTRGAVETYNQAVQNEADVMQNLMDQLEGYLSWTSTNEPVTPPTIQNDEKTNGSWNITKGVNSPQLAAGMTAIYFDANGDPVELTAESSTEDWNKWYDYVDQTGHTTETVNSGTSKWANAQTQDGSYWVWVPRYAYQIKSNWHYSEQGEIDVVFIDTANKNGGTTYNTTYPTVSNPGTATGAMDDFVVHPAFIWGTTQLPGIWVAKFEASMSDAETNKDSIGSSNIIKIQPGVTSWRSISNSDIFTNCKNMSNASNPYGFTTTNTPHMMKNTEWGAVAYLAQSKYGRNRTEITINNSSNYITGSAGNAVSAREDVGTTGWITSTGMLASTTGNIYGIYDMSGGTFERTAAYVDNRGIGSSNIGDTTSQPNNASLLAETNLAYKDVYSVGASNTDTRIANYTASDPRVATGKFGDAVFETFSADSGISWNSDFSHFPYSSSPVFFRGGNYDYTTDAGAFCVGGGTGGANSVSGFRPVCFGVVTL